MYTEKLQQRCYKIQSDHNIPFSCPGISVADIIQDKITTDEYRLSLQNIQRAYVTK